MEREIGVDTTEAGDEMILERADATFGGIAPMDLGWYQLEVNFFFGHILFQYFGAFVVEALQLGAEAGGN